MAVEWLRVSNNHTRRTALPEWGLGRKVESSVYQLKQFINWRSIMINKIKTSLFILTLIAFLLSATLGFASSNTLVLGDDNAVILMNDDDDKDKDDDDDKGDDDDKDKDDDDDDKHK